MPTTDTTQAPRPTYITPTLPEAEDQRQLLADMHINVSRAQGLLNEATALMERLESTLR